MHALTRISSFFQLSFLAALWATSFLVHTELFEGIVTAKQWGIELVVLFTFPLLIAALFFSKKLHFTLVDLLVLLFCAWSLFNEAVIHNAPYRNLSIHTFTLSLWILIYLFVHSTTDYSCFPFDTNQSEQLHVRSSIASYFGLTEVNSFRLPVGNFSNSIIFVGYPSSFFKEESLKTTKSMTIGEISVNINENPFILHIK